MHQGSTDRLTPTFRNARPTSAVLLGHSQLIGQTARSPALFAAEYALPQRRIGVAVLAKFFRALGDPTWLRLLRLLHEQDAVTEAVAHIGLSVGRVSAQLSYRPTAATCKCVEPAGPDPARVAPQSPWRRWSAWPPAKCRCAGLFGALLTASIVSAAGLWRWAMPGRQTGSVLVGRHLSFR
jgi:DNA-binding transcriptional ArsR family regulator